MVQEAVGPDAERRMRRHFELFGSLAAFHGPHLPRQLAHVLAYDDSRRPHRMLLDCRGVPLSRLETPDVLHGPRLRGVVQDLFEAVAGLHEPRLVHGRISPEHLWWDEAEGLQLAGLEGAVYATEPLPDRPATAWDAPGFRPGLPASADQDVLSAALVAFWMATGETLPRGSSREHLHAVLDQGHEEWLQELLRAAFPLGSAVSPPARELVRRLADGAAPNGLFERPLAEQARRRELLAREEFRALRARQRTAPAACAPTATSRPRYGPPAGGAGRGSGCGSSPTVRCPPSAPSSVPCACAR